MTERPSYEKAARRTDILGVLTPFDPHVVGTLPLGIALADSDIVCCAPDRIAVASLAWEQSREAEGLTMYQWSANGRVLIASFLA